MSSDTEDPRLPDQAPEKIDVISGKPRISYSREFLLSLSSLEICKKLPSGFDESLLSEFEDASQSIPDRPRIPGSTPLQGFRRIEYGSSPPARRDFGNYPRSTYGKWDTRSSVRSDRDSDSQSDKDSDSGKRYTHPSRRSWQTPEHDGLLGSGSFPRPPGYSGGVPAPKVQASEPNQLGKSSEPYQPPRPYKALPHSRRDTDAFNDETFGSSDSTSEDRAEEERRRRAAFEMMRKEQQKVLQEKQKVDPEKPKAGGNLDLFEVLEESSNKKRSIKSNELGVSAAIPISSNDTEKSSIGSGSPATRPLIPPGFKHNIPDKTSGLKSLMHLPSSEVEKLETGENLIGNEAQTVQNDNHEGLGRRLSQKIGLVDRQPSENTQHASIQDEGGNLGFHTGLHVPVRKLSVEDELHRASIHKASLGILNDQNIDVVNSALLEDKSVGNSNRGHSTSMLEKIFGGKLSTNEAGFGSAEPKVNKPDDTWSPESVRSSKFAQWFSEEESKVTDDGATERQDNLLSLIASSGDKVRHQISDSETADNGAQDNSYRNLEYSKNITPDLSSVSGGVSNQLNNETTKGAVLAPLTCEDLEQSILSEYSVKTTEMPPQFKDRSEVGVKLEGPSLKVGGTTSLDLLSLFQKGKDHTDTFPSHGVGINMADKPIMSQENGMPMAINEPRGDENTANNPNSEKSLILETLFGSAFMSQLKSAEAPVSIQRGGSGSARDGFPLQFTDNGTSPIIDQIGLGRQSHEYSQSSDNRHQRNSSGIGNWLGFDDQSDMSSKKHHTVIGFDAQPPKEENIFPVSDPRYRRMSSNIPSGNSSRNSELSSDVSVDITNKLAALSAAVKDERVRAGSESLSFGRGPFEQMDSGIPFRNLQIPPSSQFPQLPQVPQVRPPFHQMQAQTQMNFMGPEPMFNHQFPSNDVGPFHHPNMGAAGYDVSPFHPMLNQMQVRNHSPHIIPEFPRSGPSSRHGSEINQMQGFPNGPRQPQPNRGLPIPGPNINPGNTPPEAFQRLIDMELRANPTQRHPFAPDRGMYGNEVDMGFPFR